ncbi:gp007R [Rabbit fibroma virus]|uniref:Gp007L n=1 Tax=Rabbit fibroma virus (strain Kasza) TaxID=10272 RepID=Q9PX90_RFVKA|nr:gp007L [Rabbit fibroma virus]NP_052042.1 gp007R [Rabbit fibroma virus]AAF17890.1 gp007L [Rabbit fibroma virus]AAF18035.1 gp007R [Rabbit fibroma virus]
MKERLFFIWFLTVTSTDTVRLTSYDLNIFVNWRDDGYAYNVSIKPYTTGTWINVCEWASSSCNVSAALQNDLDIMTWVRLTRLGESIEYSLEPTCNVARFSPPEVRLSRLGPSVEVVIQHSVVNLRGDNVPVYGYPFCDDYFGYKMFFLFSNDKHAEYDVDDRYCDYVQCRFTIESQERVCVTAVLVYGNSYRSEAGEDVCVSELVKYVVDPYIVKKPSDLEDVKRIISNEYRFDKTEERSRLEDLYLMIASMFQRLVEDIF